MKSLVLGILAAFSCLLAGCGGGANDSPAATPPPVAAPYTPAFDAKGHGYVLYIGDSLMWRFCQPQYTAPYQTAVEDVQLGGCAAVNGESSGQTGARFAAAVQQYRPFVVVIEMGHDDIQERDTPPNYAALASAVNYAQTLGVKVILGTVPQSAALDNDTVRLWNEQVRTLATSTGSQLADYDAGILNPASVPSTVKFDPQLIGVPLMDATEPYPNGGGFEVMWNIVCHNLSVLGDMS